MAVLIGAAAVSFLVFLTRTVPIAEGSFDLSASDPVAGERIFWAAGCASCHSPPDATGEAKLVLAGGQRFETEFGTFIAPNISSHPEEGIGAWSIEEFASAVQRGVSPDGQHYYPAFPYPAYIRMKPQDVIDLKAYMDTLPASDSASQDHVLSFPYSVRRTVGLWKILYLNTDWGVTDPGSPQIEDGRYLVEALAHCGECHTPRDGLGGLDATRWMAGAPNPSGKGKIPNITPAELDWPLEDISYYLETGFTPDFDSAGGHMAAVITNMSKLSPDDRASIAAYLKALPPRD